MPDLFAFVNSKLVRKEDASLSINDMATLRGYGVFDFFLLKNGRPLFLDDHWARLQRSAEALHIKMPFVREQAIQMIDELNRLMPYDFSGVRITLTGGISPDGYQPGPVANSIVTLQPMPHLPEMLSEKGISLMSYPYRRPLANVKSIDYAVGIMLLPEVRQKGFDEILYVQDGWISECPRCNIFAVTQAGVLITPAEGVLEGITRKRVLKHAAGIMPVEQRPVQIQELHQAREVWITSTSKGIWTVGNLDGTIMNNGQSGPVAKTIYALLLEEMKG